jgi:hypothetical protein
LGAELADARVTLLIGHLMDFGALAIESAILPSAQPSFAPRHKGGAG